MVWLKYGLSIFILLPFTFLSAQNDLLLGEVPGIRNKEDFVMQFFTDYKGMTWARTVNKIYRITGGKDELCEAKSRNRLIIKEVQFYDSFFYINYQNNQLSKLNIITRQVVDYKIPPYIKDYSIILAEKDFYLVLTSKNNRLYKFNYKELSQLVDSTDINIDKISYFQYLKNEQLFFGNQKTNYFFDLSSKVYTRIVEKINYSKISIGDNKLVVFDKLGAIAFNLIRIGGKGIKYTTIRTINIYDVPNSHLIRNHVFFKEVNNDYYILENDKGDLKRFRFVNSDGIPFRFQTIYSVYEDNKNIVYISTEKGIFQFNIDIYNSIDYYFVSGNMEKKRNNPLEIRNAYFDDLNSELLLGLKQEGLYKYKLDKSNNQFKYIGHKNLSKTNDFTNTVTKIYKDSIERIWFCTNGITYIFSKQLQKEVPVNAVWDMVEDKNYYWFASGSSGLSSYNKKTKALVNYPIKNNSNRMWDILQKGRYLYLSTTEGVVVFDKQTMSLSSNLNNKFITLFTDQICWQLTENYSNRDKLFLSTQASGLYSISSTGNQKIRLLNGIDEIYQCYSGSIGNIATSRHHLFYFENNKKNYIKFDAGTYPIPGNIGFHGFCNIGENQLCVTGANGFSVIKLQKFKEHINHLNPKFFIQDIEVLNHKIYHYPNPSDIIELGVKNNNIKISFNTDYLGSTENMNISYFLSGKKDTFNLLNTNEINFINLSPGSYQLNVLLQAANGIWNTEPIKVNIVVFPPWYESLLAKIIYTLLAILLLWFVFIWVRKQSVRNRKFELIKLESELKSLRSQMNPHFMFNAMNAIQEYILNNDKENANLYLSDFSRLIRQTLNNSNKETLSLKEEINWLENYLNLEKLRFKGKFNFIIEVPKELILNIQVPTMMLQPFVENAINHGIFNKKEPGKVTLTISQYDNTLLNCVIEDDGIGIEATIKLKNKIINHESKGIVITQKRMNYINEKYKTKGKIDIIALRNEERIIGTKIILLLPYFLSSNTI